MTYVFTHTQDSGDIYADVFIRDEPKLVVSQHIYFNSCINTDSFLLNFITSEHE